MGRDLYYYRSEDDLEIDFIMKYKGKPTLVEIKSGNKRSRDVSYNLSNSETFGVDSCIKICECNVGLNNGILSIPHYMVFLLN